MVENKDIVRNWIDALNKNQLAILDTTIHPEFFDHDPVAGQFPDKAGYIKLLHTAHSGTENEYQIKIHELLCDQDKVVIRVTADNNEGRMMWKGIGIFRFQNDMIIERWACRQKI